MDISLIKKLVVTALFSDDKLMDRFVLKGGSAIDMFYPNSSNRSSVDIDISMSDDFSSDEIDVASERIKRRLEEEFNIKGYQIIDFKFEARPTTRRELMPDSWGGYQIEFKVVTEANLIRYPGRRNIADLRRRAETIGESQNKKFKVDISKNEYCDDKKEAELESLKVYVYTPELIVAEKLRAICQQMPDYQYISPESKRPRARDFYDIWSLCEHENGFSWITEKFQMLVEKAFEAKFVPLDYLLKIKEGGVRESHETDFSSVKDTVSPSSAEPLQEFSFYYDYVVAKVEDLKPLWKK